MLTCNSQKKKKNTETTTINESILASQQIILKLNKGYNHNNMMVIV